MAAPTVYQDVAEGVGLEDLGLLFAGKKFWVAQRVPLRNRLLDDIKANGGEVVMLEKNADYMIADHVRKDCPPGSISYEFVDKSIQQGEVRDPEDHRCGPPLGEAREPGAINRPAKGGRTAYTAEEDRILYKWVRDAEAVGGLAKGNEIYKQLEAKYPRHPWQSWRDRYIKQLQSRPPSAFNIPDNAPPSPPSDNPAEPVRPVPSSSKQVKQPEPRKEQTQATAKVSGPGKARAKDEYTVDELAGMFGSEDWEELYAFVHIIDDLAGQEGYNDSWAQWAENQENQTAEQWRQYYEKVVRPQWLRDPAWKHEKIKKKIESKHDVGSASQDRIFSQQQHQNLDELEEVEASAAAAEIKTTINSHKPSESEDQRFEQLLQTVANGQDAAAYTLYAREKKWSIWNAQPGLGYTELHALLISQWKSLSEADKAPYIAAADASKKRNIEEAAKLSSDVKLLSSSTARHESPQYHKPIFEKAMKRVRGDDVPDNEDEQGESSRPTKRQRSASATPIMDDRAQQTEFVGTQARPLEISSAESSISTSLTEVVEEQSQEQIRQDIMQTLDAHNAVVDREADDATESIESDDFAHIDYLPPPAECHDQDSADDLPSNTPTPRATGKQTSNFDTQAIFSSPSQDAMSRFPRPLGYMQDVQARSKSQRSSSPPHYSESDASTTQSLEEFRRSLNGEDIAQLSYPQIDPLLRPVSPSPAPSSLSSTDSGDPDTPLEADEIDEFFDEQYADGFTNEFIVKALKRTRLRPGLAIRVLDAWKVGDPLPNERGIWSTEDDEAVESGDGVALARLERKHSLDGWGGITERLIFLEAHRSR